MRQILNSRDYAEYIVSLCDEENCPINNMLLQSLLYFVQQDFLKRLDRPAFSEDFEAWSWGVVLPEVYNTYKQYGIQPITERNKEQYQRIASLLSGVDKYFINSVVGVCRMYSAWDISNIIQADGTPWSIIYNNGRGNKHKIPLRLIRAELGLTNLPTLTNNQYTDFEEDYEL